jgi:cyclopropane fatty-acyl-phospholipid synthase-like methyltransferase
MKNIELVPILCILIINGSSLTKSIAQDVGKHDQNEANQYMNRNSIESLVNAFDSPDRAEWQQPDKVIEMFGDVDGQKIMDLGAGSGYFTLRLAAKGVNVIAADVSTSFQEVISEKLENEDFKDLSPNIELRKVEYDDPMLKSEEVDGILVVNTWHHIDDRRSYMKKAIKGIKDGGKIVIVDFKLGVKGGPPDSHKLGLKDAMSEIEGLNFKEIVVDTLLLERQYLIIGIK